jgi:hypothetical protein
MTTVNSVNTYIVPTTANEVTMPSQPAFHARTGSVKTNVTGDGTAYTIIFDTEIVDQNGDYDNTTGVFTAPVTGFYLFFASALLTGVLGTHTSGNLVFNLNSGTYSFSSTLENFANTRDAGGNMNINIASGAYLTATNTVSVTLEISNGTKVVDVDNSTLSTFSGVLVA